LPATAKGTDDKVARLLDVVAIYRDRLNLDVMVVNTYLSVLALKPDHPDALAALSSRYEAQGRWNDLIVVLGKQADVAPEPPQRRRGLTEMPRVAGEKFEDVREAIDLVKQVLALAPRDPDALAVLATLYERERRWPSLVEILERQRQNVEGNAAAELTLLERR